MKKILTAVAIVCIPALLRAQSTLATQENVKYGFKELKNKVIQGSPILDQPFLVQGSTGPVKALGMGWGDPVMFDWNKDGKKDLLIGEFWSGTENTKIVIPHESRKSQIRVYLNTGTNSEPRFSDKFEYARDKHGEYLSVVTECCIGFTPRFHDLNGDGHMDIITGSFLGHVTCYYGSSGGFESPVNLEQKGFPAPGEKKLGPPITDKTGERYWSYSSADFADVDGDGLLDLITGGGALRVSRNIGTKTNPVFDEREALLDVNGDSLVISDYMQIFYPVGVFSAVPLVADWDQDGVEDLLVTNDYTNSKLPAITFFRGVRQNNTLRFEPPVSLFEAEEGTKIFPGSWLRTWVTDWNNDGINDLIIGASVATVNEGEMDPLLSWEWEQKTGIFKSSPGYIFKRNPEKANEEHHYTKSALQNRIISEEEKATFNKRVATMVHQGYVYVLLGKGTHKAVGKKPFTIQGKLTDHLYEGQRVMLTYREGDKYITDSVRLKSGRFELNGVATYPLQADMSVQYPVATNHARSTQRQSFYLDSSFVHIEGDNFETAAINGGSIQRDFILLTNITRKASEKRNEAFKAYSIAIGKKDSLGVIMGKKTMDETNKILDSLEFSFAKEYPNSYISLSVLHQKTTTVNLGNHNRLIIKDLTHQLSQHLTDFPFYKEIKSRLQFAEKFAVGKPAVDFSMNDSSGQQISLSSLRGKYVLLDFWASWCIPCLAEMPHLKKAYDTYKDKNFTILGVSLDDQRGRNAWLAIIKRHQLDWLNISDLKGADNAAAKLYGLYSIPMSYLIDPEGKIIATALRGDELLKKLAEILGN